MTDLDVGAFRVDELGDALFELLAVRELTAGRHNLRLRRRRDAGRRRRPPLQQRVRRCRTALRSARTLKKLKKKLGENSVGPPIRNRSKWATRPSKIQQSRIGVQTRSIGQTSKENQAKSSSMIFLGKSGYQDRQKSIGDKKIARQSQLSLNFYLFFFLPKLSHPKGR